MTAPITSGGARGFGVVEIVVVAGLASVALVSILQLAVVVNRPIAAGVREAEATYLAEEALEAVRVVRNESWTDNIDPLANDTTYYPIIASSAWTLTTTDPGPLQARYTRTVTFGEVYRDDDDNISDTGELDPKTRKVTATVSWTEHGQSKNVTLETYITNFLNT